MDQDVARWVAQQGSASNGNWRIEHGYHCGGYARVTPALRQFILEFEKLQGIPLEPVYTGKLVYALYRMRNSGDLPKEARLILIHSGGLQGRRGFDW